MSRYYWGPTPPASNSWKAATDARARFVHHPGSTEPDTHEALVTFMSTRVRGLGLHVPAEALQRELTCVTRSLAPTAHTGSPPADNDIDDGRGMRQELGVRFTISHSICNVNGMDVPVPIRLPARGCRLLRTVAPCVSPLRSRRTQA